MQSNNVTVWSYLNLVAIFDFDAHRLLTLLSSRAFQARSEIFSVNPPTIYSSLKNWN